MQRLCNYVGWYSKVKIADGVYEESLGPENASSLIKDFQPDTMHIDYSVKCPLRRGEKVKLRVLSLGDEDQVTGRVEKINGNILYVKWETGKYKNEVWKYDLLQPLWQAAIQSLEQP
jgi:hypothetical protein